MLLWKNKDAVLTSELIDKASEMGHLDFLTCAGGKYTGSSSALVFLA